MKIGECKQITLYLKIVNGENRKYIQSDTVKDGNCIGELITESGHQGICLKPIRLELYSKYKHLNISTDDLNKIGAGLVPELV